MTQLAAPAAAYRMTLSVPATDMSRTLAVGWTASSARVASAPLGTGIHRSINTTIEVLLRLPERSYHDLDQIARAIDIPRLRCTAS